MANFIVGYTRGSNIKGLIELAEDKKKDFVGGWCLYEGELGPELAKIVCAKTDGNCQSARTKKLGRFIRLVNSEDIERLKKIREFEIAAARDCRNLIKKHGLVMKVVRTIVSFDEKRLTFYFIANERVDFRSLVKDLVSRFHKMIRLQQIGPRDHARMTGGVGICGRGFCCSSFLPETSKVTKDVASIQGMEGLNSDKISGVCGKLMCCLKYEVIDYETKDKNIK